MDTNNPMTKFLTEMLVQHVHREGDLSTPEDKQDSQKALANTLHELAGKLDGKTPGVYGISLMVVELQHRDGNDGIAVEHHLLATEPGEMLLAMTAIDKFQSIAAQKSGRVTVANSTTELEELLKHATGHNPPVEESSKPIDN